jgi:hypothetical protein
MDQSLEDAWPGGFIQMGARLAEPDSPHGASRVQRPATP